MKKAFNERIKFKTRSEIFEGLKKLSANDDPNDLTISNISKSSGYSIGNIYHHFKNVDHVFEEFFLMRTSELTQQLILLIENVKPETNASEAIKTILDFQFKFAKNTINQKILKFLARRVMSNPELRDKVDVINLEVADSIATMIQKNETNTFKKLSAQEIELAILLVNGAMRKPVLSNHKLSFSETHKKLMLQILLAIYVES
jgi:AcrR family transcriptional regulator